MNPNYPKVARRARHVCEYCRAPEVVFNFPFEIEHIIPIALQGNDDEENLALSCRSCNLYKSDSISGFDEISRRKVKFFNPRTGNWSKHFLLDDQTGEIRGLTPTGRATVIGLRINSRAQVAARVQWVKLGLF